MTEKQYWIIFWTIVSISAFILWCMGVPLFHPGWMFDIQS